MLGGGVAGLTAAHELAERGFNVTVYERKALGGKARSIPVPDSGDGGRRDLPGEHGFRFFPGFYSNVPDTMRRIPFGGNANGVLDNLVAASAADFSRGGGRADLIFPTEPAALAPAAALETLTAMFQNMTAVPPYELGFFVNRLLVFFGSCDARRFGDWENTSWWEYARADQFSEQYRLQVVESVTRNLVAARADLASTLTIGLIGEAFIFNATGRGGTGAVDRLLNGPTNETWIDPWVDHLEGMDVTFQSRREVIGLVVEQGRVASAVADGPDGREQIEADWFVCAMPLERAAKVLRGDVVAADPNLAGIGTLTTEWMTGIQYYLDREVPVVAGHVSYIDSPWALTSISQAQFWNNDIATTYGDGRVRDILSVDISNWQAPGIVHGKPAQALTKDEIAVEVWEQIKAHLNGGGDPVLTDEMQVSWFLDPAITYPETPSDPEVITANDEPLLVNTVGSWKVRPEAKTAIANLFLAGDYVRCNFNLATMEGANETARRAVNALLAASGSAATPVRVFELYRPEEWDQVKSVDEERYKLGQPQIFDVPEVPGLSGVPTLPELPDPADLLGDLLG